MIASLTQKNLIFLVENNPNDLLQTLKALKVYCMPIDIMAVTATHKKEMNMGPPLNLLLAEDSVIDTEVLIEELSMGGFDLHYERVDTPAAFKAALERESWDLIISDYVMPRFSEPAAIEILKKSGKDIPFILISGEIGEETAVDAMKSGAQDYVMKDRLNRLIPAINRELKATKERKANRQVEQELEHCMASLAHDLRVPIIAEHRILELMASGNLGQMPPEMTEEVLPELIRSNAFL